MGSFQGKARGREMEIGHRERAENYTQLVIISPPGKMEDRRQ